MSDRLCLALFATFQSAMPCTEASMYQDRWQSLRHSSWKDARKSDTNGEVQALVSGEVDAVVGAQVEVGPEFSLS